MSSVVSAAGSVLSQALTVAIVVGWALLIGIGLEPDKPHSGGLPGRVDLHSSQPEEREDRFGRLGEIAGWALFAAFPLILVGVLVWILSVHA